MFGCHRGLRVAVSQAWFLYRLRWSRPRTDGSASVIRSRSCIGFIMDTPMLAIRSLAMAGLNSVIEGASAVNNRLAGMEGDVCRLTIGQYIVHTEDPDTGLYAENGGGAGRPDQIAGFRFLADGT